MKIDYNFLETIHRNGEQVALDLSRGEINETIALHKRQVFLKKILDESETVNYKEVIRKMMEESGKELLIYLPKLSAVERAKVQVIVMNAFFETFLNGINLKKLKQDYQEIKPSI